MTTMTTPGAGLLTPDQRTTIWGLAARLGLELVHIDDPATRDAAKALFDDMVEREIFAGMQLKHHARTVLRESGRS
jgi:hypothetical protein